LPRPDLLLTGWAFGCLIVIEGGKDSIGGRCRRFERQAGLAICFAGLVRDREGHR